MQRFLLLLGLFVLAPFGFARDITTLSGTTFHDVVVTGVERTGLDIQFKGGTAFLKFADLPGDTLAGFFQTGPGDGAEAPALAGAVAQPPAFDPNVENTADAAAPGTDLEFLPEIDALDGSVFQDVVITGIDRTGLRFRHRNGVGFLDFSLLPEQLRDRFHFNEARYSEGKAWREQRARGSAPMQRPNSTEAPTRQAEMAQPRSSFQGPTMYSNPGFRSGRFVPPATGTAPRGVSSSGSFSGRGSGSTGAGAAHVSGSRR